MLDITMYFGYHLGSDTGKGTNGQSSQETNGILITLPFVCM